MTATVERDPFRVLQVSNISTQATKDQVQQLFSYLGRIQEFKLYPTDLNVTASTSQKFAYIKFEDEKAVELGQHLTNCVLIDRAILCTPSIENVIPDEATALSMGGPVLPGQRNLPPNLTNKIEQDSEGGRMLVTHDPTLEQLGLPPYPALPEHTEPAKVEEIRRTVYVGNLPKGANGQEVADFFNSNIGEVMFVRMTTGPETLPCAYAYVEFSAQGSVPMALQNSMMLDFQGNLLKIQHSRVAIIKPQRKTADQAVEEIEEAIRKKETGLAYMAPRSRSRTPARARDERGPDRDRRRSRSRSVRRRSRSRDRGPPRDRDRRRSRSRKRETRRSPSRDRRRSRSRDRDRRSRRSRSRDRDRERDRKKSRSRSKDRKRDKDRKDHKRRSRSRTPKKKDTKRERERTPEKKKDKKDKKEELKDEEARLRDRLLEKASSRKSDDKDSAASGDVPTKISNQRKRDDSTSD
ncbi:unnamed protein product, partial [Mesorhabditis spiculigera]